MTTGAGDEHDDDRLHLGRLMVIEHMPVERFRLLVAGLLAETAVQVIIAG